VGVGKNEEETENHMHDILKNSRQNVEYNSMPEWEVWEAKEKIKIIL